VEKRYWHFINQDRKLGYGDNRIVEPGKIYTVDCKPVLCEAGLHGSYNALDALHYAPGQIICRVELSGKIVHGDDKSAATERKVIWMADSTDVLHIFARKCALDVIHLWDAPDVVIEYLKTGNEKIRAAASATASATAWATASDAASATASATASDAASAAAWATASAAASDAAWATARDAASDAARAAAKNLQNKRLTKMLLTLNGGN